MATVLTPNNLGTTLEILSENNKFNVKVDGVSIVKNPDGSLKALIPPPPPPPPPPPCPPTPTPVTVGQLFPSRELAAT